MPCEARPSRCGSGCIPARYWSRARAPISSPPATPSTSPLACRPTPRPAAVSSATTLISTCRLCSTSSSSRRSPSKARPSPAPAALLRSLFGEHFAVHDTDPAAEALEKFRAGTAGRLLPAEADILGQFCGYDFSSSDAVRRLLGQDALAHLGLTFFHQYLERL